MSSMEKDNNKKQNLIQALISLLLVFSFVAVLSMGMVPVSSNAGVAENSTSKPYEIADVYKACAGTFVSKYVTKSTRSEYDINNMYKKDDNTYYIDFTDNAINKRYLCKVYMSDNEIDNATYNMRNDNILGQVKLLDKLNDSDKVKQYTVFEVKDYNIADTENLDKVVTYNASAFSDYTDSKYTPDIKESTAETVAVPETVQ